MSEKTEMLKSIIAAQNERLAVLKTMVSEVEQSRDVTAAWLQSLLIEEYCTANGYIALNIGDKLVATEEYCKSQSPHSSPHAISHTGDIICIDDIYAHTNDIGVVVRVTGRIGTTGTTYELACKMREAYLALCEQS